MGLYKNGSRKRKNFVAFFRDLLTSKEWMDLSSSTKITYLYFKSSYTGDNNGEITLYYSQMIKIFGNKQTFSNSIKELEEKGWIVRITNGGLGKIATKYSLTFKYDKFV